MAIAMSGGGDTLEGALDAAFLNTWLARRKMLWAAAQYNQEPTHARYTGQYEGQLKALGDLLACAGAEILVRDRRVKQTFTDEGLPILTLVPCMKITKQMLVDYARRHDGMIQPEDQMG